jgi:hypothetical protein
MPAGLPGSTLSDNLGNPNKGASVLLDPASGPKGSPFDAKVITGWTAVAPSGAGGMPTTAAATGESSVSTGGLSTGIGFGLGVNTPGGVSGVVGTGTDLDNSGNFMSQYTPGTTLPSGSAAADARLLYIGGGKSSADGVSTPRAVSQICEGGGGCYLPSPVAGASRDAGGGAGFGEKLVIATGNTAFGAAIVTGFLNRMAYENDVTGEQVGLTLPTGQAQFGSATASAPIPT